MKLSRLMYLSVVIFTYGCAHHPIDCAVGFPWSDCLEGTAGYNNGGGSDTREMQLKIEMAKKQSLDQINNNSDLKTKLIQLDEMKKQGLINEDEYQKLRTKYLDDALKK